VNKLEIKRFTSKMLGANTYILYNNGHGIVVDPCTKISIIKEFCNSNGIKINQIILTHCHIDHTLYLQEYLDEFNTIFAIHENGNILNQDENLNGARLFGLRKSFGPADILLKDGSEFEIGSLNVRIIATPGHSPGSICLYSDNLLISGDTLFNLSIGRSDLPGGNQEQLMNSLKKISELPDDTIIYPGHGTFSTIKFEKANNPYLKYPTII